MFLPIYTYGHPILRKKSTDISPDYPDLDNLLKDMWQTMETADGVGLAAPQIGKNIRIFVIAADVFSETDPRCKGFRKAFINAHILERGGDIVGREEGCLSIPGIHENVKRPSRILMQYCDETGKEFREEFDGILAWIIQHEYDHLEGILFTDHVTPLRKRLLKNKLNAIAKGKSRPNYRTVSAK